VLGLPADPERALAGRRTVRPEAHVHPQPSLAVDHPDEGVGPLADALRPAGAAAPVQTGRRASRHPVVELRVCRSTRHGAQPVQGSADRRHR